MRIWMVTGLGALAASVAVSAVAAPRDLHAAAAIRAGDLVAAEAILSAERDGRWTSPETLLNLAHVYRQTGRGDAAQALYQRVLADGNVLLNTGAARPLWSHDIARAAIARGQGATAIAAIH